MLASVQGDGDRHYQGQRALLQAHTAPAQKLLPVRALQLKSPFFGLAHLAGLVAARHHQSGTEPDGRLWRVQKSLQRLQVDRLGCMSKPLMPGDLVFALERGKVPLSVLADARINKELITKRPGDPRLPVTGMERADRNWLIPQCV